MYLKKFQDTKRGRVIGSRKSKKGQIMQCPKEKGQKDNIDLQNTTQKQLQLKSSVMHYTKKK